MTTSTTDTSQAVFIPPATTPPPPAMAAEIDETLCAVDDAATKADTPKDPDRYISAPAYPRD